LELATAGPFSFYRIEDLTGGISEDRFADLRDENEMN
jgi:hypothetical protein